PERHVAAGDVLGLAIGDEDVHRSARCAGDALGDRPVARWRDVRPAHTGVRRAEERGCEVRKPVRVGVRVVVDICDDLARRGVETGVARNGQAAVRSLDQANIVATGDRAGAVRRPVVYYDHFVIRIREAAQALQAITDRPNAVEG